MSVSRVLNGHSKISESTRARVLRSIDELDFRRNRTAHALATRKAHRIGVVIDGPVEDGPNSTLRALELAARQTGYAVTSFSIGDDGPSQIDAGIVDLVAQGVDAICIIVPRDSSLKLLRQQPTGLPTVVVKAEPDACWHTVGIDQRKGARLAVEHLIKLGHRTIAHLAGPADWFEARERAEGWRESLVDAGLRQGTLAWGSWTSDFGYRFARSFDLQGTTAVFAASDQIALGVIHAFRERGIRVPQDVSVVGFDDLPSARHFLPPLTTIRQDFFELGVLALQQATTAIEKSCEPLHRIVQPELVVRESTCSVAETRQSGPYIE